MKIFNTENGKEKVYVQLYDLRQLYDLCQAGSSMIIPESVKEVISTIIVSEHNYMDFTSFEAPEEIKFFESIDFIDDYKQVRKLSEVQIESAINIITDINEFYEKALDEEERDSIYKPVLLRNKIMFSHKLITLNMIMNHKRHNNQIPLPLVEDSDSIIKAEDYTYKVAISLESHKLLITKKDGSVFTHEDNISMELIRTALNIASQVDGIDCEHEIFDGFKIYDYYFDETKKIIIAEIVLQVYRRGELVEVPQSFISKCWSRLRERFSKK